MPPADSKGAGAAACAGAMALETPAAVRMSDETLAMGRDVMMRGDKVKRASRKKASRQR
jgi:hypothetical protein